MLRSAFLLLVACAALLGCDETVPPTLNTGQPFTMWGALNPGEDVQALRVVPIQLQIDANQTGPVDAEVVATNLDTGDEVVWRDSVVQFADGSAGNVFVAEFRPGYGQAYEVVATRSDGATSTARLVTPLRVDPVRLQPTIVGSESSQRVLWPEAPRLNDVEITYGVRQLDCSRTEVTLPGNAYAEPFEFGWQVVVPYDDLRELLAAEFGTTQLALFRITIRALVTDANWKPPFGFGFNDDLIIQPGTVSNVENGFGFVGSAYPSETTWRPGSEELRIGGFLDADQLGCR